MKTVEMLPSGNYEIRYKYAKKHGDSVPKIRGLNSRQYPRGIALFNQAAFFESHELLEDAWRDAPEPERKFLQALIQTAVAFHHYSKGNRTGARSLLERGLRNLAGYPGEFGGIELTSLRQSIVDWQQALDQGAAVPSLPTLKSCVAGK